MDMDSALTWSWLQFLTKRRAEHLRSRFGSLDQALSHLDKRVLLELGCKDEVAKCALERLKSFDVNAYRTRLRALDIRFLSTEDVSYPKKLREIGDPPFFLYYRGDLSLLDSPCIARVGTRRMSHYGKRVVSHLVPGLVRAGLVTVSGLAMGIDAEVARVTIAVGGKTVVALGHGLQSIYPHCNTDLARQILDTGGLLLSEFPLDTVPGKFTFPARNRIIAGLALGTVVLEAGEGSGALITSDLALDYGREAFAVPGQIFDSNYTGCHQVISSAQAKLVTDPSQILEEIGMTLVSENSSHYEPKSKEEEALMLALSTMPAALTEIVAKSQLEAKDVNALLTEMELLGIVKSVGNGQWVKS